MESNDDLYNSLTPIESVSIRAETPTDLYLDTSDKSPSALEGVVDHYLNPDHLPARQSEMRRQFALLAIALSGAPLYVIPASDYSMRMYDDTGLRVSFIIGTCTPALVVLYNATDTFLTLRDMTRPPAALNQVLKTQPNQKQNRLEDIGVLVGSAISSVPLTIISLAYPMPGIPKPVAWLLAAAILFDNTILHFLPIKLAFSNPLYRIPALPFEYLYKHCIKKQPDEKMRKDLAVEAAKQAIYGKYKNAFVGSIAQVKINIALHALRFDFRKLQYRLNLPDNVIKAAKKSPDSGLSRLTEIMTYTLPPSPSIPLLGRYDPVLKTGLYGVGAFWVISSCSGYLAATVTELTELTDSPVAGALLSTPSVYFLSVLFAFFGGNSLIQVFDYLTSWHAEDVKIPLEFKYFPKIAAVSMLLSLYLAAFSYAAADELIRDNYDEENLDGLFDVLIWLAVTGVPYLSFTALIGFTRSMLGKLALHYGDEDVKLVAELDGMLGGLQNGTNFISGDDFMKSLEQLSKDDLEILTGLNTDDLEINTSDVTHGNDEFFDADITRSPRGAYTSLHSSVSAAGLFSGSSAAAAAHSRRELATDSDADLAMGLCHSP